MIYRGEHKRNLATLLSQYIGRDKRAIYEVAHLTGIKVKTIRSHMNGKTSPYFDDLCEYIRVLPPEFTTGLLSELGYRAVAVDAQEEDGCYRAVLKETADFTYHAAQYLEDGVVDHREHLSLLQRGKRLAARMGKALHVWRLQAQ